MPYQTQQPNPDHNAPANQLGRLCITDHRNRGIAKCPNFETSLFQQLAGPAHRLPKSASGITPPEESVMATAKTIADFISAAAGETLLAEKSRLYRSVSLTSSSLQAKPYPPLEA